MSNDETDLGKVTSFIFSVIVQLSKEVVKSAIYSIKSPFSIFVHCQPFTLRQENVMTWLKLMLSTTFKSECSPKRLYVGLVQPPAGYIKCTGQISKGKSMIDFYFRENWLFISWYT